MSNLDNENSDIGIEGGTDATVIGNVSDRMKVDLAGGVNPFPSARIIQFFKKLQDGSNSSMDVNGSVTPVDFISAPPSGEIWYLEALTFFIYDSGSMDTGDYGSISGGLSNGFQLILDINSTEHEYANFQNNMDIQTSFIHTTSGIEGDDGPGWMDDDDWFAGSIQLRAPIKLIGDDGDQLIGRVRDNLNGVNDQEMRALFSKEIV